MTSFCVCLQQYYIYINVDACRLSLKYVKMYTTLKQLIFKITLNFAAWIKLIMPGNIICYNIYYVCMDLIYAYSQIVFLHMIPNMKYIPFDIQLYSSLHATNIFCYKFLGCLIQQKCMYILSRSMSCFLSKCYWKAKLISAHISWMNWSSVNELVIRAIWCCACCWICSCWKEYALGTLF